MVKQYNKFDKQNGSALILVVVVTVLLAVVGVMFLMVSRASELETHAVIQNKDLNNAVDTIVARINEVLVEDLFGADPARPDIVDADAVNPDADEPYDYPSHNSNLALVGQMDDSWLGTLEPVWLNDAGTPADPTDDNFAWEHLTDLFDIPGPVPPVVADISQNITVPLGLADADGDGVTDGYWVPVPGLTSSRGESVFAAVRIIDNCAMLNLNAAHCFYQEPHDEPSPLYVDASGDPVSPFAKPWFYDGADYASGTLFHDNQSTGSGRYITEINYLPFLRGSDLNSDFFGAGAGDDWYNLMIARGFYKLDASNNIIPFSFSSQESHNVLMNIENPLSAFQFFDISDELELRNRYLLTSKTESRFERAAIANFSLDSGGGVYSALQIPRDNSGSYPISAWYKRVYPANFDNWSGAVAGDEYKYDRRHVCTFYSYDRNLRKGQGPLLSATLVADGWTTDEIESAPRELFWYPQLYSDLNGIGWGLQEIEAAQRIFWPVGQVTTDIETPFINYKYDDADPSILYPFATSYNNVETRRKILHLLFAFREYFRGSSEPAKRAAQVVANIIDYSDQTGTNGPFAFNGPTADALAPNGDIDFKQQLDEDCTFLTEDIIQDMIFEVSTAFLGAGNGFSIPFGLDPDPAVGIVFGYEKQPFISKLYTDWGAGGIQEFAVEFLNPYNADIPIVGWKLTVGASGSLMTSFTFPAGAIVPAAVGGNPGRTVVRSNNPGFGVSVSGLQYDHLPLLGIATVADKTISILRPAPAGASVTDLVIDIVESSEINVLFGTVGQFVVERDEGKWGFIRQTYSPPVVANLPLGQPNVYTGAPDGFQIGVADDGLGLSRWHELEVLGLYGNGPEGDPNLIQTVPSTLTDPNTSPLHFDLAGTSSDLLDYVGTINRPDLGSLPGRININTAPVHVIAAAIPPSLADPNAAIPGEVVTLSSLQLAQDIINYRQTSGPFEKISDLLNIPEFNQYVGSKVWADPDADNVGNQSIEDDIEEKHWILSNLANKFTVRSDTFTAYILVRLGEEGPQRRMIGIFDRSQVWDKDDRPKLVALHPVPQAESQ